MNMSRTFRNGRAKGASRSRQGDLNDVKEFFKGSYISCRVMVPKGKRNTCREETEKREKKRILQKEIIVFLRNWRVSSELGFSRARFTQSPHRVAFHSRTPLTRQVSCRW